MLPADTRHFRMNRNQLKLIAVAAMLGNHIAQIFLSPGIFYETFLYLGYITAVIMIYLMAGGVRYTSSPKKYFLRLFVTGIISQIPYSMAFAESGYMSLENGNMMFTLCFCFLIMWTQLHWTDESKKSLVFFGLLFLSAFFDWPILGPAMAYLFVFAYGDRKKEKDAFLKSAVMFGVFLFLNELDGLTSANLPAVLMAALRSSLLGMMAIGIAACLVLHCYDEKLPVRKTTSIQWFFYLFYPVHLMILAILRIYMNF